MKLLLEKKASVNEADCDGHSAVIAAALFRLPEVLHVLLAAKADVNHARQDGNTALLRALAMNSISRTPSGVPVPSTSSERMAAPSVEVLRSLIDAKARVDLGSSRCTLNYTGRVAGGFELVLRSGLVETRNRAGEPFGPVRRKS